MLMIAFFGGLFSHCYTVRENRKCHDTAVISAVKKRPQDAPPAVEGGVLWGSGRV
jgi:hypothetical protein